MKQKGWIDLFEDSAVRDFFPICSRAFNKTLEGKVCIYFRDCWCRCEKILSFQKWLVKIQLGVSFSAYVIVDEREASMEDKFGTHPKGVVVRKVYEGRQFPLHAQCISSQCKLALTKVLPSKRQHTSTLLVMAYIHVWHLVRVDLESISKQQLHSGWKCLSFPNSSVWRQL